MLALVGRWVAPAGGVTIEFVDVQVTLAADRATAQVYSTARFHPAPTSGRLSTRASLRSALPKSTARG